jgi:hypothetical protein
MAHGGVAILLVYLLTFLDATRSEGGAAVYLVAAWAFVTGLVLSHIFHEWCHFLGSVVGSATVSLKPRVHPLFFEFDLDANSHTQFILLSAGGLCGNVLLLLLVSYGAASHSLVMTSLLAAVAGQLVFVLILELPVSIRVLAGAGPLEALTAHFGQGGPLFLRAAIGGVTTAALIFALSSFR